MLNGANINARDGRGSASLCMGLLLVDTLMYWSGLLVRELTLMQLTTQAYDPRLIVVADANNTKKLVISHGGKSVKPEIN